MKTILKPNEKLEDLQLNNLYIIQSDLEYRFTSDAVALANFVHVSNFGRVVDLCSGSGVVGILVNAKNRVKDVTLVEIQQTLADMSLRSCQYNKFLTSIPSASIPLTLPVSIYIARSLFRYIPLQNIPVQPLQS